MVFCGWGKQTVDNRPLPHEKWQKIENVDIPTSFAGKNILAFMGWNGLLLKEPGIDVVDMTREYLEQTQEFSCGRCVPCRVGTRIMANLVKEIIAGRGKEDDLEKLENLGREIIASSKCEIGKTTPVPVLQALKYFREDFSSVIAGKRTVKQGKYRGYMTAPCLDACPAHLDVPTYVELIKERRFEESLALIRERNALPGVCGRVCVRPCEFQCRRGQLDDPVQIRFLKRFVADYELNHQLEVPAPGIPKQADNASAPAAPPVAIVGAGPAGLACAYYLALKGIPSTVYEALPTGGGMAGYGIPSYRLPREILGREVEIIEKAGGSIVYNTRIGKDKNFDDLWQDGYKAIFVASGSHESKEMMVDGEKEGYRGFIHGVTFLRDVSLGKEVYKGKKAVIVGGGNVAIDCVRTMLRLGYTDVNLLYRRSRKEMPADAVEIEDAEKEGVKFNFLTLPKRIIAENGKVKAIECLRMELGEPDASGRRRPIPVAGSEFILDTDVIIPAIGQDQDLSFLRHDKGIVITKWETVEVDPDSMMSEKPGVFSGGDCVSGPLTLIAALAAGYDAAISIEQYLQGKPMELPYQRRIEKFIQAFSVYNKEETVGAVKGLSKSEMAALPVETRIHNFAEVELGFTPQEAVREANRCLRCYRVALLAVAEE